MSKHYKRQQNIITRKKMELQSIYSRTEHYKLPHEKHIEMKNKWRESFPSDTTGYTRAYLAGYDNALFGQLLYSLEWGFMTSDGWKTRYQDVPESDLDEIGRPKVPGYHAYAGTEGSKPF